MCKPDPELDRSLETLLNDSEHLIEQSRRINAEMDELASRIADDLAKQRTLIESQVIAQNLIDDLGS